MTVADALKRFRLEMGLSQKDVAEQLEILPQAYSRYEVGKFIPRANDIIKLAQVYGVTTDYLLGMTDEPRPKPQEVRDKEFFARVSKCAEALQEALNKAQ